MASRRKKRAALDETEIEEIVQAAARLHEACCRPLIHPAGDHYRALQALNGAAIDGIRAIGREPPWTRTPASWEHPGVPDRPGEEAAETKKPRRR